MSRLTVRDSDGIAHATKVGYYDIIDKLAYYEDLADLGKLLELPVAVGDTIYRFWYADDKPYKVQETKIRTMANLVLLMEDNEFGKTVFLTKEEAEKVLEEMRKQNEVN